jgi:hypothetical protein
MSHHELAAYPMHCCDCIDRGYGFFGAMKPIAHLNEAYGTGCRAMPAKRQLRCRGRFNSRYAHRGHVLQ